MSEWSIVEGDCAETIKSLQEESVDCCFLTPPFYTKKHIRKEHDKCWGREQTEEEFIQKMISILSDIKRVIRKNGSCWIHGGEGYGSEIGTFWKLACEAKKNGWFIPKYFVIDLVTGGHKKWLTNWGHSYMFLLTLEENDYYYNKDPIIQSYGDNTILLAKQPCIAPNHIHFGWTVIPLDVAEACVMSTTPENGIVLNPFSGSGTVGMACIKNNRRYIGYELNPYNCELSRKRLRGEIWT